MKMRCGLLGSSRMVCRHMPPAPGCQRDPEPWPRSPGSSCQVCPPSVERNKGGVFHPGVDRVGIGERRFQVPDALELPGVRRAVVPLVRAGDALVDELVAHRLPRLAAVVGALDQLPEPAAGLRRIQAIRIGGRALHVVHLPAAKMRAGDVPFFALAVRRQDECALPGAHQNSYATHTSRSLHSSPSTECRIDRSAFRSARPRKSAGWASRPSRPPPGRERCVPPPPHR